MDQGLLLQPGSDSDDEQQQWAVSPECQASIPAWRRRPAQPTASEAKFLQAAQVYPPSSSVSSTPADDEDTAAAAARTAAAAAAAVAGGILDLSAGEFQALYRATVPKDRAALLASTVAAMDQQLGPHLVKVSCAGGALRVAVQQQSRPEERGHVQGLRLGICCCCSWCAAAVSLGAAAGYAGLQAHCQLAAP